VRSSDLTNTPFVYFRLETHNPTTSPGIGSNLGTGTLDASVLSIEPVPVSRPNILFCMADDWGGPHAGAYGTDWIRTPHFDRLASEGVLFTRAFSNAPSCTPARGVALTGLLPWRLGSGGTLWGTLPVRLKTFPDLLASAGYKAGFTGKGWGPGDLTAGGRNATFTPAGPEYNKRYLYSRPADGIGLFDYAANFEEFLSQRYAHEPFVFWYGAQEPHRPYEFDSGRVKGGLDPNAVDVPTVWPYTNTTLRKDIADYAWEVEHADDHLGQMLAHLESIGELGNTIVIVTGDHGMPFPRMKANLYDGGTRVPFVVRWGNGIDHPDRVVDDLVSFVDLAPTLLDLAGVSLPSDLTHHGQSLRDLLEASAGGTLTPSTRPHVLLGMERHGPTTRDGLEGAGYPMRAIRTAQYLYIRNGKPDWGPNGSDPGPGTTEILQLNHGTPTKQALYDLNFANRPAEELYDVLTDPDCANNLANDPAHATVKTSLATTLETRQRDTGDPRVLGYGSRFFATPYYKIGETPYPRDYPGWEGAVETELTETGADGQARMTQLALGTQEAGLSGPAFSVHRDETGVFFRYRTAMHLPEFSSVPTWTDTLTGDFSVDALQIVPVATEGTYQWYEARPTGTPEPDTAFFTVETAYTPE
jgi:uncharacterized sulfatase